MVALRGAHGVKDQLPLNRDVGPGETEFDTAALNISLAFSG